jgi:hypothetical protein
MKSLTLVSAASTLYEELESAMDPASSAASSSFTLEKELARSTLDPWLVKIRLSTEASAPSTLDEKRERLLELAFSAPRVASRLEDELLKPKLEA